MDTNPKHLIKLPNEVVRHCTDFAWRLVNAYHDGRHAPSLAVSSFGAENNFALQQHAKCAECAFALFLGFDPQQVLHWDDAIDCGYDVEFHGLRIDVKSTAPQNELLIWPYNKQLHVEKPFDLLVLVRGADDLFEVAKWTSKQIFIDKHHVANAYSKLKIGTRYMKITELFPADDFLGSRAAARLAIRCGRQFEYIAERWPSAQ